MRPPFPPCDLFDESRFPALVSPLCGWAMRRVQRHPERVVIPSIVRPFEDGGHHHWHHRPELFIQVEGQTQVRIHGATLNVDEGSVLVIPRGVDHREAPDNVRQPFCNVVIAYAEWGVHLHSARAAHPRIVAKHACTVADGSTFYRQLDEACTTAASRGSDHPLVHGLLLTHLARLADLSDSGGKATTPYGEKVLNTLYLIHRNIAEPGLTVDWLAHQVGCTPDYLSHRFSTEIGSTIIAYIHRDRISRSHQLLGRTDLTIAEVARSCGYADPGYFTRIFRRLEGRSPRTWRNEHTPRP